MTPIMVDPDLFEEDEEDEAEPASAFTTFRVRTSDGTYRDVAAVAMGWDRTWAERLAAARGGSGGRGGLAEGNDGDLIGRLTSVAAGRGRLQ